MCKKYNKYIISYKLIHELYNLISIDFKTLYLNDKMIYENLLK